MHDAFGPDVAIVGILEIGSFAKEEAVPTSDTDTRIYVTAPHAYLRNNPLSGSGATWTAPLAQMHGDLPIHVLEWDAFNDPVGARVSEYVGHPVEFGFADWRRAAWELQHLHQFPTMEHSFLSQSNILYDRDGGLARIRDALHGVYFAPQAEAYRQQSLVDIPRRLCSLLDPDPQAVAFKLEKSGQLPWVQYAVRTIRSAAMAAIYAATGRVRYKKPDILRFYQQHLPDDFALVHELYAWKTDPQTRAAMVAAFIAKPAPFYARFRSLMPQLQTLIHNVAQLPLKTTYD